VKAWRLQLLFRHPLVAAAVSTFAACRVDSDQSAHMAVLPVEEDLSGFDPEGPMNGVKRIFYREVDRGTCRIKVENPLLSEESAGYRSHADNQLSTAAELHPRMRSNTGS
jgi:hypothetical protein